MFAVFITASPRRQFYAMEFFGRGYLEIRLDPLSPVLRRLEVLLPDKRPNTIYPSHEVYRHRSYDVKAMVVRLVDVENINTVLSEVHSVSGDKKQIYKFREAARELETDDDEKRFDATLGRIARAQPPKYEADKKDKSGQ